MTEDKPERTLLTRCELCGKYINVQLLRDPIDGPYTEAVGTREAPRPPGHKHGTCNICYGFSLLD